METMERRIWWSVVSNAALRSRKMMMVDLPESEERRGEDTHTHPFNGPFSWTTRVTRYQKGKTNVDFTVARHSE